jgi:hypothetical protein
MMFDFDDEALMQQLRVPLPEPGDAPGRKRAERLRRLPTHFIRVPLSWLTPDGVFGPRERLFLLLLYRSHWGQKGVRVTNALAAEIGIPPRTKTMVIQQLVNRNAVRIEQRRREAPVVWPRVIVG